MNYTPLSPSEHVAAVDLGSNSFHMIVSELRAGKLLVVDRLREIVRLGSGLTHEGYLTHAIQQRALECLQRFGQRIRHLPKENVRAVGTNTLRVARNAASFLVQAEEVLGYSIELISGIEEARLIYSGVSQELPTSPHPRLVIDIGGGSTELIIGINQTPLQKESTAMGCVSMSLLHFPDGKITQKRFKKAVLSAQQALEPHEHLFCRPHWKEAIGASGTMRATQKMIASHNAGVHTGIYLSGLEQLIEHVVSYGKIDKIKFPELNADRIPSLPGGLAIVYALFKTFDIERMTTSDKALREGLLYDLVGRLQHEDIRSHTVASLTTRYHADIEHNTRIQKTLSQLIEQITFPHSNYHETIMRWLGWAIDLHEIGRDIAHSGYHKHGAYILENADLPGFSRQDQYLLSALVRAHRRKLPEKFFKEWPHPWNMILPIAVPLLRIAILLNRNRSTIPLPPIYVTFTDNNGLTLRFPFGWLSEHPLTVADLEQEAEFLYAIGYKLLFS